MHEDNDVNEDYGNPLPDLASFAIERRHQNEQPRVDERLPFTEVLFTQRMWVYYVRASGVLTETEIAKIDDDLTFVLKGETYTLDAKTLGKWFAIASGQYDRYWFTNKKMRRQALDEMVRISQEMGLY